MSRVLSISNIRQCIRISRTSEFLDLNRESFRESSFNFVIGAR